MISDRDRTEATVEKIRAFADDLVAGYQKEHPDLFDSVHGEKTCLDANDRLVPRVAEIRRDLRMRSAKAGYYGGFMPREVGGAGWTQSESMRIYEDLANRPAFTQVLWPDLVLHLAGETWGPNPVLLNGGTYARDNFLPRLMSGEWSACTAITDPRAGSDPYNMFATATKSGRTYKLNGVKQFVGNSPYADLLFFYARTSGEHGDRNGISLFAVEADRPGVAITRIFPVMEGRGNHGEITLTNCEVPEANLVGVEGQGFRYLMQSIDHWRLMLGAISLGASQWCLDRAVERAEERTTFGVPLSERQGLRWMLADVAARITGLRALVRETARMLDEGRDARRETAVVKLFGPNVYGDAADVAMQIHGGTGYLADSSLERHYRRARGIRIYIGTDEIQRNTIANTLFRKG